MMDLRYKGIGDPKKCNIDIELSRNGKVLEIFIEWEVEEGWDGTNIDIPIVDIFDLFAGLLERRKS